MANPKCVFEFKRKAKYTPSKVKKGPVNVKSKEDKIEIRNGIDGIHIHGINNVNHSGCQVQEFPPIDVGSDGIPTNKLSRVEIQPQEVKIEQVLQTLDGINEFVRPAIEVKMDNVPTKEDITDSNCVEMKKVPIDDDVMNGVICNEIKNNNSNAVSLRDDENEQFHTSIVEDVSSNNTKTDDVKANGVEIIIIGNCTDNLSNVENVNDIENNEAFKNDLESGDAKMYKNIEHQDTRLVESNESVNLPNEVVMKSTDLLQTVQNIHPRSITLLIQPTDTKNTGLINNGYRDEESDNHAYAIGAPFGDTENPDDPFSGGQVSGPSADDKISPRKKKWVSVVNENIQPIGDQSGTENAGFISDDDSIDMVIDISKLPRRSIRFSVYSAFKFPSEPKWKRKLGACVVVFCAFWNCFFAMGIAFSMGTFLPEWLDEFNDGRAKTAMIQSVLVGVTFGAGILIGISIDRYGVRLTIFAGSLMSCCGFLGAIFCPSTTTLLLSVAILPGLGLSGAQLGSIVAVSMACKRSVSVAIGLITAGGGCGSSILPYFFQFLIDKYGWRDAFFVIAGLSLQPIVFGFLMTAFMDQLTASRGHRVEKAVVTVKEKVKLMCRLEFITAALWALTAFAAANGFLFIIVDYADTKNQNGVFLLFLLTIISTCGRLAFGFLNLLSFVNSRILLTIAAILSGGSLICLGFATQYSRILGILVVLGFNYGGQTGIYGIVILDLVGPQTFSLALGLCSTLNGTGSAIGGVIYGLLYDMSGSYSQPCIIMGTICCVFGVLPMLGLFYRKIKTNCKSAISSD